MNKVTGPGLPSGSANYTYVTDSSLVSKTQFKTGGTVDAESERHYESTRDLADWVEHRWGSTPDLVSKYAYVNDAIGRRTSCVRTGNAFAASHHDVWAYNDRNELTGTTRKTGTTVGSGTAVPAEDRAYVYDPTLDTGQLRQGQVGNRTSYTEGTAAIKYYCANELNQYETIDDDSSACPVTSPDETLVYDVDGNLIECANAGEIAPGGGRRVTYSWDAENRLTVAEPVTAQSGDKKVTYTYDYMGRRVEKKVFVHNGTTWPGTPATHVKYVWFNWLCILELDGLSSNAILKKYTWGLDLAGLSGSVNSIEQAGGIGGLLSVLDTNGANPDLKYVYCHDANGNVVQMLDCAAGKVSAAMVAKYEYDGYGNVTAQSGTYATSNTWRFSTKQWDTETALLYNDHRYLSLHFGKWLSRDPIGELGGIREHGYVGNAPTLRVDALGLVDAWVGPQSSIISWLEGGPGYNFINTVTNKPPPTEFESSSAIGDFLATKDFRNYLKTAASIECCSGKITDASIRIGQRVGYTNVTWKNPLHWPGRGFGEHHPGKKELKYETTRTKGSPECVRIKARARFQVAWYENYGQMITQWGVLYDSAGRPVLAYPTFERLPHAWSQITYTICCDGDVTVDFQGSIIPSHNAYIDNQMVASISMDMGSRNANLTNSSTFASYDENEDAPGRYIGGWLGKARAAGCIQKKGNNDPGGLIAPDWWWIHATSE